MKNNKKAQMNYVVAILLVLTAAIILMAISGRIIDVIKGAGKDAECRVSVDLSSRLKVAGVQTLELNCRMELIDITMDDLRAQIEKTRKELKKLKEFHTSIGGSPIELEHFGDYDSSAAGKMNEYTLNKIIGEEMKSCWFKMGEGDKNLFNAWYADWKNKPWKNFIPTEDPPKTCVICSRIKFDDKIAENFQKNITSINEYLKLKKIPKREETYYSYLIDELHDQWLFTPQWQYEVQEPLAVVFTRMNPQYPLYAAGNILGGLVKTPDAIDAIYLIKYKDVGTYCDYLANKPPEELE